MEKVTNVDQLLEAFKKFSRDLESDGHPNVTPEWFVEVALGTTDVEFDLPSLLGQVIRGSNYVKAEGIADYVNERLVAEFAKHGESVPDYVMLNILQDIGEEHDLLVSHIEERIEAHITPFIQDLEVE